jgi:hypothetical protein
LRFAKKNSIVPLSAVIDLSNCRPRGGSSGRGGNPHRVGPPPLIKDRFFRKIRISRCTKQALRALWTQKTLILGGWVWGAPRVGGPPLGGPPLWGAPPPLLSKTDFFEKFEKEDALSRPYAHFGPQKPCFWGGYPK